MYRLSLLALLAIGCSSANTTPDAPERPAPNPRAKYVETITVAQATAPMRATLPGEVESEHDATLATPRGGYVDKVLARRGDRVRKGMRIAHVDLAAAQAEAAQAKANFVQAEQERSVVRAAGDGVSKTHSLRAEAQFEAAEANLRMANSNLRRAGVVAPFSGIVVSTFAELGEVVAPGMAIARLVDIDHLRVTVSVSDRDIGWIKTGTKATIVGDGGQARIQATVSRVGAAADLNTRTFIAEVDLPDAAGLLPGMVVSVVLEAPLPAGQLTIPQHALVTGRTANGVYVVLDGQARWRDVAVDGIVGHNLLISEGLQVGDVLVVRGHRELRDGDAVLAVNAHPTGGRQ